MPFGFDDLLLLVASASPLLWAKRGDVVSSGVYAAVSLSTRDAAEATRRAEAVARRYTTPCALLRGLDAPLVSSSVAAAADVPPVPHRSFRPARRRPALARLDSTPEEVSALAGRFGAAEVRHLLDTAAREGNWEAAMRFVDGLRRGAHFAHLTPRNLDAAARALLSGGAADRAADWCLQHAREGMLSEAVVVALFDACRQSARRSLALCEYLAPFRPEWTPAVYACCLTAYARLNWTEALRLYEDAARTPMPLQYLHHTIVPLVAERQPNALRRYYDAMMREEAEAAVDVLLRCLHTAIGRDIAAEWLRTKETAQETQRHHAEGRLAAPLFPATSSPHSAAALAIALYTHKPCVMNLNSLLKVLMSQSAATPSSPAAPAAACEVRVQHFLRDVQMTDTDACVLARTVTDHCGHWALAAQFMSAVIARRQWHVLPTLASHVARQGRWALAAKALSIHLSNRASGSVVEMSLGVESAVFCGRWRSALFWLERAHSRGMVLPSSTYDLALGAARHGAWDAALRAFTSMHEVGGLSSEKGILDVIETAAAQDQTEKALEVVASTGKVYWTL